jgi:hypothetical protein
MAFFKVHTEDSKQGIGKGARCLPALSAGILGSITRVLGYMICCCTDAGRREAPDNQQGACVESILRYGIFAAAAPCLQQHAVS